jgi:hypothetical protein
LSFASKDEELRVHLVEIAIGILRAAPKEDVTPARGWAIDVIEKNSGVQTMRRVGISLGPSRAPSASTSLLQRALLRTRAKTLPAGSSPCSLAARRLMREER